MTLIKSVKKDGNGDYTSISAAFTDMLVSGLASTGEIIEYYMIVDDGLYNESFSGYIPYSGLFYITSSGAIFDIYTPISVSGEQKNPLIPNLQINNVTFIVSGLSTNLFTINSNFGFGINNVQIMNDKYGIQNNGGLCSITNCDSYSDPNVSSYFLRGSGINYIDNLKLSNYETGIYVDNLRMTNSIIHNNRVGIYGKNNSTIDIDHTLFYNNLKAIDFISGYVYVNNSTFDDPIYIDNSFIQLNKIIINDIIGISGAAAATSVILNSCLYPQPILNLNITESGNIYSDPKFNNSIFGDYRLQFKQTEGSSCIEVEPNTNISSDVIIDVNSSLLQLFDEKGLIKLEEYLPFVFTQGSTVLFCNHNNEYTFAEFIKDHKSLSYQLIINAKFTEYNIQTQPSFETNLNYSDPYPWDWDIKTFNTTRIGIDETYLIPRSIINLENIITSKLGSLPGSIFYESITKNHIKIYDQFNYRGISFDSNLSNLSESIIWLIDGNNQSLIKQNLFTGENIETYPLLCASTKKNFARPSGLIYVGVDGDYYKFIKLDDPSFELKCYSEKGDLQWLPTNINTKYDLRGILNYNDNIFITASQYSTDIASRSTIPTGLANGRLLWYKNNDLYYNYTKMPGELNGPTIMSLVSGNYYPTDLTLYEDGSILIADYKSLSGIYKYKLAYDYALVQSSYDNETRILLREYYNDVDL